MTVKELQNRFLAPDAEKKIAPEDFFILLAEATGKDKAFLLAHPEFLLEKDQTKTAISFMERRSGHEPVALIVGHKEFFGMDFLVTKDTLVPRPETELMVEGAVAIINESSSAVTVADIGTGSGCVIISIARTVSETLSAFSSSRFLATDISDQALSIAKLNAERSGLNEKISFFPGDLILPIMKSMCDNDSRLLVCANLPYLSQEIYDSSPDDVKNFEPKSALWSDENGLDHYHRLLEQVKRISEKRTNIHLLMEISPEQKNPLIERIKTVFPDSGINVSSDLSGRDRLVETIIA